eukprot:403364095
MPPNQNPSEFDKDSREPLLGAFNAYQNDNQQPQSQQQINEIHHTGQREQIKGDIEVYDKICQKSTPGNSAIQSEDLSFGHVFKQIINLSTYPIISMLFHPGYHMINTIMIGRMENPVENLAIFGLASVTNSLFLMSVSIAFNNALSTLISQAHGQKEPRLCSLYLNRQLILNVMIYLPIIFMLLFSEYIYLLIGQEPRIAREASHFSFLVIPGLFFFGIYHTYSKYLAGQREVRFSMFTNMIAFFLHIPTIYFIVEYLGFGLHGVAIATSIHLFNRFWIIQLMIRFSKFHAYRVSFRDQDCYKNLRPQFIMSLQSCGMIIWSWWAFDMFTFMSSFMSMSVLAAQTVCRNLVLIFYMIPVGLTQATAISVGNKIGQKNIQGAKIYAFICTLLSVGWGSLSVIVMVVFDDYLIMLFTESEEVRALVHQAFVLIGLYIIFDCTQCIGSGIIAGVGRQGKGSVFTIIGFWLIGIPVCLVQVFYYKAGIEALWFGPLLSHMFNTTAYYVMVLKVDWNQILKESETRRLRDKKNA